MSRVFLATPLEGIATFWRVFRRDGITLAFTTHDRDLWFDGLLHRAAPGMLPSSIRRSIELTEDPADVEGVLSHDTISEVDLVSGRFDGSQIMIGAVDWETLESAMVYAGSIGSIGQESNGFVAQLRSAKALLDIDPIPRTSPTCRARFCGPGCTLSPRRFTSEEHVTAVNFDMNAVQTSATTPPNYLFGELRWIDGPDVGLRVAVRSVEGTWLILSRPLAADSEPGLRIELREGCDHRLETCADRFGNAVNFQAEPFLPGNDLLSQYPSAS